MNGICRFVGSLICFLFGIIVIPICFIIAIGMSFYFTFDLISMYYKSVNDIFYGVSSDENVEVNEEKY